MLYISKPSLWDNPNQVRTENYSPAGEGNPELQSINPELASIRESQRKIIPYVAALREAATEVVRAADKTIVDGLEQCLNLTIFYRMPIAPNWANVYFRQIADYPILLEADEHARSPVFDRMFPVQPIASLAKKADVLSTQIHLDALRSKRPQIIQGESHDLIVKPKSKKEELGSSKKPPQEFGRVVYPNLLEVVEGWIQNMDGPIWHLRFTVTPVNQRPDFRHEVYSGRVGRKPAVLH